MQQRSNSLLVSTQPLNKMLFERSHAIGKQSRRMQQVADHQWLEDIQFEVTVHTTNGSSDVITHDLRANHSQGLTLRRVDFSGHDTATGLVLRQVKLAETAAGSRAEEADILRDLEQRAGKCVQSTRGLDDSVVRGEDLELVGCGDEFGAREFRDFSSDGLVEALVCVDACADGGASLSETSEMRQRGVDALDVAVELGDVA